MSIVDERVLEYLAENRSGSPTKMREEVPIPYSPDYVGERCRILSKKGFLIPLGNGVYAISEDGRAYLEGELDATKFDDEGNTAEASA